MSKTPGYDRGRLYHEEMEDLFAEGIYAASAPASATKAKAAAVTPLSSKLLEDRLWGCVAERGMTPSSEMKANTGKVWGQGQMLSQPWSFWVDSWEQTDAGETVQDLQSLCTIVNIKNFWDWYGALGTPKNKGSSFYVFRAGIRPRWEDEANKCGGHFTVLPAEDMQSEVGKLWMDLSLAVVAEMFEGSDMICGAGISNKGSTCTLQLWVSSRDKTLEDMLHHQLMQRLGNVSLIFNPHNRMKKGSEKALEGTSCQKLNTELCESFALEMMREKKRSNSCPPPDTYDVPDAKIVLQSPCIEGIIAMSARAGTVSPQTLRVRQASIGSDTPLPPPPKENPSRRAKKAGVMCLNPCLVETNIVESVPPVAATPMERGRLREKMRARPRSKSETESALCVPMLPILSARKAPPATANFKSCTTRSPLGSASSTPQSKPKASPAVSPAVPPAGPSPVKHWYSDSPNISKAGMAKGVFGGAQREQQPEQQPIEQQPQRRGQNPSLQYGKGANSMWAPRRKPGHEEREVHRGDVHRGDKGGKKGRGCDHDRGDFRLGKGMWGYREPSPNRRGKGYGQGKSSSSAFTHEGYLYPPGLNRKQRRTIIFSNEQRKGDLGNVEGVWIGKELRDGTVTEEEYSLLRAGKIHPSKVIPQPISGWTEKKDGDMPDRREEERPTPAESNLNVVNINTHEVRSNSPVSNNSDLPPPPALGPPMSQMHSLQNFNFLNSEKARLNPDAVAFTPQGTRDQPPMIDPPALLNGVPYVNARGQAGIVRSCSVQLVHLVNSNPSQPGYLPAHKEHETPPAPPLSPPLQGFGGPAYQVSPAQAPLPLMSVPQMPVYNQGYPQGPNPGHFQQFQ